MISFPERILRSPGSVDIIQVVNEFLSALRRSGSMRQIPPVCRPLTVRSHADIALWLRLISLKINERAERGLGMDDALFALQGVLETAERKLREFPPDHSSENEAEKR
jgi:hypothetical protein